MVGIGLSWYFLIRGHGDLYFSRQMVLKSYGGGSEGVIAFWYCLSLWLGVLASYNAPYRRRVIEDIRTLLMGIRAPDDLNRS